MNYLVIYFNNITKNVCNELIDGSSIRNVIYKFTHSTNRTQGDSIVNIIKME